MELTVNEYQTQKKIMQVLVPEPNNKIPSYAPRSPRLAHLLKGIRNTPLCPGKEVEFITCHNGNEPLDYQLALIASDVYSKDTKFSPENLFQRLTSKDLREVGLDGAVLSDENSGFQANLYSNGHQIVLAFAGTNDLRDWMTNIRETLGLPDAQYSQAVALAKQARECFGERLVITGHSLGGSLATVAACATSTFAVTFNSAGLSEATLTNNNIDPERAKIRSQNGSIRTYNTEHDILQGVQKLVPFLPKVFGHKITLKEPNNPSGRCSPINLPHFLEEHKMDLVLTAMPA